MTALAACLLVGIAYGQDYPEGGYLEKPQLDPDGWKHDFIYELTPGTGSGFVIRSCGPDGEQDTEDDLLSTDVEK